MQSSEQKTLHVGVLKIDLAKTRKQHRVQSKFINNSLICLYGLKWGGVTSINSVKIQTPKYRDPQRSGSCTPSLP